MKQFKPCSAGCGSWGAFKNGICDECWHKKDVERALAKEQKRKAG